MALRLLGAEHSEGLMEPELYTGAPQEAHGEWGTGDDFQQRKKVKYVTCHTGGLTGRDDCRVSCHTQFIR